MELLLIVLPAFLIFTAGFIGQRVLTFDIKSISKLSLYLLVPFLTFDTFYTNQLNADYFYIFVFTVFLTILLVGVTYLTGKLLKADRSHMSAMQIGSIFPNSGNYGAPVALFAFGGMAFEYAIIIMVIHAFLINSIGIFLASLGGASSNGIKGAFNRLIRMPVMYGAILGMIFQILNIPLPSTIIDGISMVGSASIPVVMLILGMQLAEIKLQKFKLKYVSSITILRMVVSPLLALALVTIMPVSELIKHVFLLLSAMPVAANTTILAVQFDCKPDLLSFTTLVTTLLSLISIPLLLYLL
ncbi:AEC family transporter [Bacillus timonensis]|uniref:AEC family transporter n=1 Tax=Bacillus timonensis TaxID=1033734 RepID=A0A4S3PP09_9BACI|nr:AEC family transporter [Bacillus timonensis]THE11331.1 AEC family transporter [Bacillus timonensis]